MKQQEEFKRPYGTHYYYSARDVLADVAKCGAASTENGAIRATVSRVFLGEYEKAIIYDRRTGVPLYGVRRRAGGISVDYGSGVDFKKTEALVA